MKLLLALVLAVFVFPAAAWAEATLVTRELPVNGARTLAATDAPTRFNLLGLHWRGSGQVSFRVRTAQGWSPVARGRRRAGGSPRPRDRGGSAAAGLADREPVVDRHRRAGAGADPRPRPAGAGALRLEPRGGRRWSSGRSQIAEEPSIILRRSWGANEAHPSRQSELRRRRCRPRSCTTPPAPRRRARLRSRRRSSAGSRRTTCAGTGGTTSATTSSSTASARSSRAGTAGSSGTSSARTRRASTPAPPGSRCSGATGRCSLSAQARDALARLIAWRLDVAHVDPVSRVSMISNGNPRFRTGLPTWMRAVSGHRDTGFTSCPGAGLYGQLGALASRARSIGLPKLFTPEVEGSLGSFVSFSARLSSPLAWTVTVSDSHGQAGGARGRLRHDRAVDVGLRGSRRPGRTRTQIAAGLNARPIEGTIGASNRRADDLDAPRYAVRVHAERRRSHGRDSDLLPAGDRRRRSASTFRPLQGMPVAQLYSAPAAGRERSVRLERRRVSRRPLPNRRHRSGSPQPAGRRGDDRRPHAARCPASSSRRRCSRRTATAGTTRRQSRSRCSSRRSPGSRCSVGRPRSCGRCTARSRPARKR